MISPKDLYDEILIQWRWPSITEILETSGMNQVSYTIFAAIIGGVIIAVIQAGRNYKASTAAQTARKRIPAPGFPDIEPLEDFDWQKTEPLQSRPFKPKFHLTMDSDPTALQNLNPSDLILMDKNFADRLEYRKQIMSSHHDTVVNISSNPTYAALIAPAVRELYQFLFATYLPTRYPKMFRIHEAMFDTGVHLMTENLVTKKLFPAIPKPDASPLALLETLGANLDEEFLLLLPQPKKSETTTDEIDFTDPDRKYVLMAFVCVCASGFSPLEKLDKKLADIHGPVPAYKEKLEGSMDKFFHKVEVGKYVTRVNWTVTVGEGLFAAGKDSTHGDVNSKEKVEELKELDITDTFLRSERQTLHRLPHSKALVFGFKTHLYPIAQVKEEGYGPELADAIDGLKEGNAPGMHVYKRGAVWGSAVKKYLRS